MAYRRRGYQRKEGSSTFALNITSMTDMFTIMLAFLLQTYASSDAGLTPGDHIQLPTSNSELSPSRVVQIKVSPQDVLVGDKKILSIKEGDFNPQDIDQNDKNFIPILFGELEALSKSQKSEDPNLGKVLLQADASLSYRTLRRIMYTSSMAGFPQVKIATIAGN